MSRQVSVAGGTRQTFETVDDLPLRRRSGAHELRGPVLEHYLRRGGPAGNLGFPTSDVRRMPNGNVRASFEHGVITCDADGSCRTG